MATGGLGATFQTAGPASTVNYINEPRFCGELGPRPPDTSHPRKAGSRPTSQPPPQDGGQTAHIAVSAQCAGYRGLLSSRVGSTQTWPGLGVELHKEQLLDCPPQGLDCTRTSSVSCTQSRSSPILGPPFC